MLELWDYSLTNFMSSQIKYYGIPWCVLEMRFSLSVRLMQCPSLKAAIALGDERVVILLIEERFVQVSLAPRGLSLSRYKITAMTSLSIVSERK